MDISILLFYSSLISCLWRGALLRKTKRGPTFKKMFDFQNRFNIADTAYLATFEEQVFPYSSYFHFLHFFNKQLIHSIANLFYYCNNA